MSDTNVEMINDCPENGVIFDVGANKGSYTFTMAKRARKVYAFEPGPENIKDLRKTVGGCFNVEVHEIALSNCNGTAKLMLVGNPGGHSIHASLDGKQWHHKLEESVDVHVLTLDTWCQHNGITSVDGIKIDVEAHELEVLEGARDTLKKYHPRIALETHQTVDVDAIKKLLEDCGYDVPNLERDKAYFIKQKR